MAAIFENLYADNEQFDVKKYQIRTKSPKTAAK